MARAAKVPLCASDQWSLKHYGRFLPNSTDRFGVEAEAEAGSDSSSWKVFESNDKYGALVLTIVVSGHFFISQGQTLLEGFSLIDGKKWLKIVRQVDSLLFGSILKEKSRMFRVQFGGNSEEQALENCFACVQKLEQYITIYVPDDLSQELQLGPSLLIGPEGQGKDGAETGLRHQRGLHLNVKQHHSSSYTFPDGRITMIQLAQSVLTSAELPLAYEQAAWNAGELGPFLKLCLMDQNFPAFVEDVEKELKKLIGLGNSCTMHK
ncbi:meiotic recombination protein REC114 [Monodelphis domestica]|uniref:REC114 meiotic recombination protein n=1 Tax=Monodelphis domestica TaxID=13616 RepID=F6VUR3_MONDO|nr:meiotic recombination protein REC114 [Monodelphis domestica]